MWELTSLFPYVFYRFPIAMKLMFCAACGGTGDLNHHHAIPRVVDGPDDESNLITLCRGCHGKIHAVQWAVGHSEAIKIGLARAVAEGKQLGRPRINRELEQRILAALKAPDRTEGVRKIAARFGVNPGTVQRRAIRCKAELDAGQDGRHSRLEGR